MCGEHFLKQRLRNAFFHASWVIILCRVDSGTHTVAAHGICWIRFEQIEYVIDLFESRIKPPIMVFTVENDRHSVMNVGQKRICRGCNNRTRFDQLSLRVLPSVPNPSECKN